MLRSINIKPFVATAILSSVLMNYNFCCNDVSVEIEAEQAESRSIDIGRELTKIAIPINKQLHKKSIKFLKSSNDVDYYTLTLHDNGNSSSKQKKRLPLFRIATTTINAPLTDVENTWYNDHELRAEYDTLVSTCNTIKTLNTNMKLMRVKGNSGIFVPARDYPIYLLKTGGGVAGINNINSSVIIASDASNTVSKYWNCVRGQLNSILVLEPSGSKTKATYIVECDYSGWIFTFVSNLFADKLSNSLLDLKKYVESQRDEDEDSLDTDTAARRRFEKLKEQQRKREMSNSTDIIDDVNVDSDMLESMLLNLENRLQDLQMSERKENINLGELKKKVRFDIERIKERLRHM